MKYLWQILLPVMFVASAHGGEVYIGTMYDNLNKTNGAPDGYYYRCVNSVKHSCAMYARVDYTSKTGGSGTEDSPYILSGCSLVSCACWRTQYRSSETACTACKNNALGTQAQSPHTNTSCSYCETSHLKTVVSGVVTCSACPANASCNGTTTVTCAKGYYGTTSCTQCPTPGTTSGTGAGANTSCYVPANTALSDTKGKYKFTKDCYYTN